MTEYSNSYSTHGISTKVCKNTTDYKPKLKHSWDQSSLIPDGNAVKQHLAILVNML